MTDSEPSEAREGEYLRLAAERLCISCGMCCNGVLFEIVRLQPQDSVRELERLGMAIYRRKKEPYFKQPCSALDGCTCTIYAQRPTRCRHFECRQLKLLAAGEISVPEIETNIRETQALVQRAHAALAQLGDESIHESLGARLREALASHEDADLHEAAQSLRARLARDFHSSPT